MPFKNPEKRREAIRKSCKKAYWADGGEKGRAEGNARHAAHREEENEKARQRRAADPVASAAYHRAWNKSHSESRALARRKQRLKQLSLTIEDYDRMFLEQGGLCKVCGETETLVKNGKLQLLSVEHCHSTGRVRGLTCNTCNRGLGLFKDDPKLLRAAADYLEP